MFVGMLLLSLSIAFAGAGDQARSLGFREEGRELFREALLCAIVGFVFLYVSIPKAEYKPPSFGTEVAY